MEHGRDVFTGLKSLVCWQIFAQTASHMLTEPFLIVRVHVCPHATAAALFLSIHRQTLPGLRPHMDLLHKFCNRVAVYPFNFVSSGISSRL